MSVAGPEVAPAATPVALYSGVKVPSVEMLGWAKTGVNSPGQLGFLLR